MKDKKTMQALRWKTAVIVGLSSLLCTGILCVILLLRPAFYQVEFSVSISNDGTQDKRTVVDSSLFSDEVFKNLIKRDVSFSLERLRRQITIAPRNDGSFFVLVQDSNREHVTILANAYLAELNNVIKSRFQQDLREDKKLAALDSDVQQARAALEERLNALISSSVQSDDSQRFYMMQHYVDAIVAEYESNSVVQLIDRVLADGGSLLTVPSIAHARSVQTLMEQQNRLSAQIAHMQTRLGAKHVQVKAMISEYDELSYQIGQESLRLVEEIKNDAIMKSGIAQKIEREMKGRFALDGADSASQQNSRLAETAFIQALDAKAQFLHRASQNGQPSYKIQLLGHPDKITAVYPFLFSKLVGCFFLTLIIFSCFCFVFLHKSLKKNNGKEELFQRSTHQKQPVISVEELANTFDFKERSKIVFLGLGAEEQAARVALNAYKSGKKYLLIDLSGGEIDRYIGLQNGIKEVLNGQQSLEDVVYHDDETGVDILAVGKGNIGTVPNVSRRIQNLFVKLYESYDGIVLSASGETDVPLLPFIENSEIFILMHGLNDMPAELWAHTLDALEFYHYRFLKI